jgi:uncharacterized delta-60 repeat protein
VAGFVRATSKAKKATLLLFSVAVLLAGGAAAVRGQSADGFDPNANNRVFVVVVQPDGKILIGGGFTTLSPNGGVAVTRNRIARLNPDGTLDMAFNPNASGNVFSIVVQTDGQILVGGGFTSIGGQTRNRIARLDPTTGLADSFDPNANDWVYSIAVQADGKILAGGYFTSIGGQTRNRIARLDPTTGLADSFDPNAQHDLFLPSVVSIAVQADGKILAGGQFTSIGGQTRNHIARLETDVSPTPTPTPAATPTPTPGASPTPTPAATPTPTPAPTPTGTPTPTPTPTPRPATLGNISTRLRVETGDNVLIGGFIVTGTQPKRVILRAIGPSLGAAGVPDVLANPILELHDSSQVIASNDNWMDAPNRQEIIDSTLAPTNDLESAILMTLPANNSAYTAIVRGVNNGTGVGLVEAYDLDRTVNSKLANISTRGLVQTGDNVMIGGFIVVGNSAQRVIVRAIGPSLPVPGRLADPTLELHDGNGALLQANDNWMDAPNRQEIIDSTLAPTNDLESAILMTLPANNSGYTAIVRGVNGTTGVALVEVYALQ